MMYLCRLFALNRMVEVLLYNLSRLHDFWPLLLDHIVELLSDMRPPVRLAAIDALSRALIGALAACLQSASVSTVCPCMFARFQTLYGISPRLGCHFSGLPTCFYAVHT